jgi:hypothetical protein
MQISKWTDSFHFNQKLGATNLGLQENRLRALEVCAHDIAHCPLISGIPDVRFAAQPIESGESGCYCLAFSDQGAQVGHDLRSLRGDVIPMLTRMPNDAGCARNKQNLIGTMLSDHGPGESWTSGAVLRRISESTHLARIFERYTRVP